MTQESSPALQALRRATASVLCASALLMAVTQPAQAQSEISVGLSMLPIASVVGTASVAGGAREGRSCGDCNRRRRGGE